MSCKRRLGGCKDIGKVAANVEKGRRTRGLGGCNEDRSGGRTWSRRNPNAVPAASEPLHLVTAKSLCWRPCARVAPSESREKLKLHRGSSVGIEPVCSRRNANTFPALAEPLGFVPADDIFHAIKAIVATQRDYGRRDDRKQARLKYLIHEWGIDKFRTVTEQYYGKRFEPFRYVIWSLFFWYMFFPRFFSHLDSPRNAPRLLGPSWAPPFLPRRATLPSAPPPHLPGGGDGGGEPLFVPPRVGGRGGGTASGFVSAPLFPMQDEADVLLFAPCL